MKAVVFHGIGDIRLDDVQMPRIKDPNDAIVRIMASAICGTDLHIIRGTMPGMEPGTILGHEGLGIVEEVGANVHNLKKGDRVVIPSSIACGYCSYCRAGYFAYCDNANPTGNHKSTFFGGPRKNGSVNGLQAEFARVPFANVGLVKIPEDVSDAQAIMLSDVFPTGYFGAELAEIKPGNTVAVFGCGPVGQFAIISALLMDAGQVIAVDRIPSRLEQAQENGAEAINFEETDPIGAIRDLTGGIGVDRVIDAVGVDAVCPDRGPAAEKSREMKLEFDRVLKDIAPNINPHDGHWVPGNAPQQVFLWAMQAIDKAGTFSIIGEYPEEMNFFPIGRAIGNGLTIQMGACSHRRYIPLLMELIRSGAVDPTAVLSGIVPFADVIQAYESFDQGLRGWTKVEIVPAQVFAGIKK